MAKISRDLARVLMALNVPKPDGPAGGPEANWPDRVTRTAALGYIIDNSGCTGRLDQADGWLTVIHDVSCPVHEDVAP